MDIHHKQTNTRPRGCTVFTHEKKVKELKVLEVNAEGIPTKSRMTNLKTGSNTTLEIHSLDTTSKIPLSNFTKEHLMSGSSTLEE